MRLVGRPIATTDIYEPPSDRDKEDAVPRPRLKPSSSRSGSEVWPWLVLGALVLLMGGLVSSAGGVAAGFPVAVIVLGLIGILRPRSDTSAERDD